MAKVTDIILFDHPAKPVLMIKKDNIELAEIADFVDSCFDKLNEYMDEIGELTTDVPFIAYYNWENRLTEPIDVAVVFPTAKLLPGKGEIKSETLPEELIVTCMVRGGYRKLQEQYDKMKEWAEKRDLKIKGSCYEFYYNYMVHEEDDCLTRVMFPVTK